MAAAGLILLIAAILVGCHAAILFAMAESHPTPSQTRLIGQFIFALILCLVLLGAASLAGITALLMWWL